MIRLESVLKTSLQDVLKMSWRRLEDFLETSWRRLENVLKTPWRRLEDVLKTSWKRFEDVLKTYSQDEYIGLDQDVLKTSSEDVRLRRTYSSWSRRLQDVFIKTNVCWAVDFEQLDACWDWTIDVQLQWKLSKADTYWTKTGRVSKKWDWNEEKHISEAEHGSRNIPLTTNLISLLISELFGLSIKAGKIIKKQTKFLSDVGMSTVERVS